jgi:hypothetical protein
MPDVPDPLKPRHTVCSSRCRVRRWRQRQAKTQRDRDQEVRACLLAAQQAIDLALGTIPHERDRHGVGAHAVLRDAADSEGGAQERNRAWALIQRCRPSTGANSS